MSAVTVAGLVIGSGPLLSTVAGAKAKKKHKTTAPLYIGSVLGTTGSFAGFDLPQEVGLKQTVNQVNKAGGILGHKLVYVNIDDNSQSTKFGPAMEELLQEHKYLAVFPTPAGYLAQLTYTNAEKVITFGGGTPVSTEFNPTKYPYDFNDAPVSTIQLEFVDVALQKWAGTKPVKVGIIVNSLTGSLSEMTVLSKEMKAQGITVLPLQTVTPAATTVTVQLSQLQQGGANVVYPFPNNSLCTATFQGVQTLKWNVKILGSANCLSPAVVKTIPSTVLPEVRYFAVATTLLTPTSGKVKPNQKAFDQLVHGTNPTASLGIAGVSSDGIHDLVWAANYAKSTTETKVLKALNTMYAVKIPATTFFQEPNPRWSPSDHLMDRATFNDYYGIATVAKPQVTGLYVATTLLSKTNPTSATSKTTKTTKAKKKK